MSLAGQQLPGLELLHHQMQVNIPHSSTLSCLRAPTNCQKEFCLWGNTDLPQQGNALPDVIDQLLLPADVISKSSLMFVFIEVILPYQHCPVIISYTHICTKINPDYLQRRQTLLLMRQLQPHINQSNCMK